MKWNCVCITSNPFQRPQVAPVLRGRRKVIPAGARKWRGGPMSAIMNMSVSAFKIPSRNT